MIKFGGALTLLGVLVVTACSGPGPSADVNKRAADSNAPVIVTGTVRKAVDGKPAEPVAGATITLTWSTDRAAAKSGATLEPAIVAKATTDGKGRYTVRGTAPQALVKGAAKNDGIATISMLVEATNGDFTSSGFTRQIVNGTWRTAAGPIDITYRYDPKGALKNGGTQ
ncbi:peptidase associated/transthyretin-like domain-containing protein [Tenggerimyces flavus]|uniref:Uncharacterized protein n=1 Tax=Tenggerimyces flavus TaxID=1708749 RepID=A0ABV7Y7B0_9ACTN|nr:hypothetical protein [Tenggerimyces flavus]MBM7785092.1 hypothetical protein [Tenggerimyces flavus]